MIPLISNFLTNKDKKEIRKLSFGVRNRLMQELAKRLQEARRKK